MNSVQSLHTFHQYSTKILSDFGSNIYCNRSNRDVLLFAILTFNVIIIAIVLHVVVVLIGIVQCLGKATILLISDGITELLGTLVRRQYDNDLLMSGSTRLTLQK